MACSPVLRRVGGWLVLGSVLLILRAAIAVDKPDPERINDLIGKLGSSDFREREEAGKALKRLGKAALPALRKAAEGSDLEVRRRAEELLVKMEPGVTALARLGIKLRYDGKLPATVLTEVRLGHRDVRDADLVHLRRCHDLRWLSLGGKKLTDTGLAHLDKLPNLTALDINYTSITGKGLKHLKQSKDISFLGLQDSKITDDGLANLKLFPRIRTLALNRNPNITDRGLAHLVSLKYLIVLQLNNTGITDAGLVHLEKLRNLRELCVSGTKVTAKRFAELKKKLPNYGNFDKLPR